MSPYGDAISDVGFDERSVYKLFLAFWNNALCFLICYRFLLLRPCRVMKFCPWVLVLLAALLVFFKHHPSFATSPYQSYSSPPHTTKHVPMATLTKHNNHPTLVLLITYMRGGSTLLGEFFNLNDDVFYWYEPLPAIFDKLFSRRRMICRHLLCHMIHLNGTVR